jgi:2-keto-4-pentenoate hydratase/2-oxohepta-3-ene-1,7-dioic acid hydratase in catechol pathway
MKLASYLLDGKPQFGAVVDDGLITLTGRSPKGSTSLRDSLARDSLDDLKRLVEGRRPDASIGSVQFLPVIPDPAQFFAAGVNYRAHVEETGRKVRTMDDGPAFFLRLHSSLVAHDQPVIRPKASSKLDFEGELALVIGRGGRHIPESEALSHLAGYTCFMDGSVRDYQKHSVSVGKNFQHTGPLGPWMVTTDEIPDPTTLTLATRLNGETMQQGRLDDLIFSIPFIVSYLSRITPLQPGDVIATGTPSGVGRDREPSVWMKPGDRIEVDISGIGVLSNPIEAE